MSRFSLLYKNNRGLSSFLECSKIHCFITWLLFDQLILKNTTMLFITGFFLWRNWLSGWPTPSHCSKPMASKQEIQSNSLKKCTEMCFEKVSREHLDFCKWALILPTPWKSVLWRIACVNWTSAPIRPTYGGPSSAILNFGGFAAFRYHFLIDLDKWSIFEISSTWPWYFWSFFMTS